MRAAVLIALALAAPGTAWASGQTGADVMQAAFGNTVISYYPDGDWVKHWFDHGGVYRALFSDGRRLTARWAREGDKICLNDIRPRMIVTLGKFAAQCLLRTDAPISALRGSWHRYQGIALMPTFHPAYLLRNPPAKREVWDDLKQVIGELDRLGVPHGPVGKAG